MDIVLKCIYEQILNETRDMESTANSQAVSSYRPHFPNLNIRFMHFMFRCVYEEAFSDLHDMKRASSTQVVTLTFATPSMYLILCCCASCSSFRVLDSLACNEEQLGISR